MNTVDRIYVSELLSRVNTKIDDHDGEETKEARSTSASLASFVAPRRHTSRDLSTPEEKRSRDPVRDSVTFLVFVLIDGFRGP